MIGFILGLLWRLVTAKGRNDIRILLSAQHYAARADRGLQAQLDGHFIDCGQYRMVIARPGLATGELRLTIQTPDGTRTIGVITRHRAVDLWHDNPTHRLAWA